MTPGRYGEGENRPIWWEYGNYSPGCIRSWRLMSHWVHFRATNPSNTNIAGIPTMAKNSKAVISESSEGVAGKQM